MNKTLDITLISLALQGYNYGKGYVSWAVSHFGRYTKANAQVYSDEKKAQLNTSVILNTYHMYYDIIICMVVIVFKSLYCKLVGGKTYWQWYGFDKRVEWCAILVSWFHQQTGDLGITVPKFSAVRDGVKWFRKNYFKITIIPLNQEILSSSIGNTMVQ